MRKLRDYDGSGALKEFFGDGEDPRKWKDRNLDEVVTVKGGRVTVLQLYRCSIVALPAAIGELDGLTRLNLSECSSLAALPAAIGALGALTKLNLSQCSSLVTLPDSIGELKALTGLYLNGCTSLAALPDAIGELKALTELELSGCSSLAALPAAIGELGALTQLVLYNCSSLVALPDSIAGLDALTDLRLDDCSNLTFPPPHMHNDVEPIKRLLANTTRLLDGDLSAIDADGVKTGFFEAVLLNPSYADRLETAVRKTPALADLKAPGDDKFKQELQTYGLFKNKDRFGKRIGSRAIVMDAADLNLFQIYQTERPDLNAVRVLMHPRRTLQGTQFDAHRARAALR